MSGLSEDDALWKPAPDRFSSAETLAHLTLTEGHCYRGRIDRIMALAATGERMPKRRHALMKEWREIMEALHAAST